MILKKPLYWPLEIRKEFHFHAQENVKMDRHIYKLTQEIPPTSAGSLFWFRPVFNEQCPGILQGFLHITSNSLTDQFGNLVLSCSSIRALRIYLIFKSALKVDLVALKLARRSKVYTSRPSGTIWFKNSMLSL